MTTLCFSHNLGPGAQRRATLGFPAPRSRAGRGGAGRGKNRPLRRVFLTLKRATIVCGERLAPPARRGRQGARGLPGRGEAAVRPLVNAIVANSVPDKAGRSCCRSGFCLDDILAASWVPGLSGASFAAYPGISTFHRGNALVARVVASVADL